MTGSEGLQHELRQGYSYLRRCWKSFYAGISEILPLSPKARAYRLPVRRIDRMQGTGSLACLGPLLQDGCRYFTGIDQF